MNRDCIINFYQGTDYKTASLSIRGMPPRPSEWNMPVVMKKIFPINKELFEKSIVDKEIKITLDNEDIDYFKPLLLHESLFNFYKAFYNYLCALKMYDGGLEHWINITSYYSKLYLANCMIALVGKSRYVVKGNNHNFDKELYQLINPSGYQRIVNNNGEFIKEYAKYGIEIDIDISQHQGEQRIIKNLGGSGSHTYIWKKYAEIKTSDFGITEMTYDYPEHLSDVRNIENYSFEGYRQLDFNLPMDNFRQYFERDYIKGQAHLIYTSETAIILGVIGELFNLYKSLEIHGLPIEEEKLIYITQYTLGETEQSEKLLDLINSNFPNNNKYLKEYYWYESS